MKRFVELFKISKIQVQVYLLHEVLKGRGCAYTAQPTVGYKINNSLSCYR